MKKLIGFLGLMLLITTTYAQRESTLEVLGIAKEEMTQLEYVTIEVFKDGVPYDETQSMNDGSFELTLVGEGNFIVKAAKEGYNDRYMIFSTHAGEKGYKLKSYEFDLLFFTSDDDEIPTNSTEIPVITYDGSTRDFSYTEML